MGTSTCADLGQEAHLGPHSKEPLCKQTQIEVAACSKAWLISRPEASGLFLGCHFPTMTSSAGWSPQFETLVSKG